MADICTVHNTPLRAAVVDGRPMQVCVRCAIDGRGLVPTVQDSREEARPARAHSETAQEPSSSVTQQRKALRGKRGRPEDETQAAIVAELTRRGHTVLVTSRRRRGVWCRCGRWCVPTGGDGVTPGTPDLLVWSDKRGAWIGIEVKGPTTSIDQAQRELALDGRITIVRSVEAAIEAVCERCNHDS